MARCRTPARSTPARTVFAASCAALFAILGTFASAAPVKAQSLYVPDVAFFERAFLGPIDVTPIAVFRDTRCADLRLCTREDSMVISALLENYGVRREILLEIDRPIAVPGGFLVLRSAGTPPVRRGAIPLDRYRLGFEYIPLRPAMEM